MRKILYPLAATLLVGAAHALDPQECLDCHESDEYKDLSIEQLQVDLTDPGIRQHADYMDITLEQIADILAASNTSD